MKKIFGPALQEIIINADDFGHDPDSVLATIECFRAGALTSATIMPKMPATALATKFARANPQHAYGIHLTFVRDTVESPVADPGMIPALLDKEGAFFPSHQLRLMALLGNIPVDQLCIEISAQIERLIDAGVPISHVDSHGHLHKFKPFVQALSSTLPRYGLSRVRNVQNQYTAMPLKSPTYWMGAYWRRRIMRHFVTTPHFFMDTNSNDPRWIEKILARPINGVLEVGFHPGSPLHGDAWRNNERLACLAFAVQARERQVSFISWNDISTQPQLFPSNATI
ncbi:Cellobiose phosphotransferase system YdjC-like protein [Polaromonas sp. CG9_12]|nr:Cellobiose phosphotransferase system YdjC-like protein [Polaromonas sp. CG9_12]